MLLFIEDKKVLINLGAAPWAFVSCVDQEVDTPTGDGFSKREIRFLIVFTYGGGVQFPLAYPDAATRDSQFLSIAGALQGKGAAPQILMPVGPGNGRVLR